MHRHREQSPGGTIYQVVSEHRGRVEENRGRSPNRRRTEHRRQAAGGHRSRREASGYINPNHEHGNMLPLYRRAALSPIPGGLTERRERQHLMDSQRRFRVTSPGRTRTATVQGHNNTVLGHQPGSSAGEHWNRVGHTQPRRSNLEHNRQTSAYHGLEHRPWSDASGAGEARYQSPRPSRGSHPSYYNVNHPDFQGGFGSYYEEVQGRSASPVRGRSDSSSSSDNRSVSPVIVPVRPRPHGR